MFFKVSGFNRVRYSQNFAGKKQLELAPQTQGHKIKTNHPFSHSLYTSS